jgi:carboxylesterase type B
MVRYKAIVTSPGYIPHVNTSTRMTALYITLLDAANCTNTSCLRSIPESAIAAANAQLIMNAPPAVGLGPGIGFGPIVDGDLVPELPDVLLAQGRYHRSVKRVLTANMENDGDFDPGLSSFLLCHICSKTLAKYKRLTIREE